MGNRRIEVILYIAIILVIITGTATAQTGPFPDDTINVTVFPTHTLPWKH